jgi:DNA modification methylase
VKELLAARPVVFRDMYPVSTTYATHGIYYYPAKFIPHVVRYCIENYAAGPETRLFDPFAGSGTAGVEAYLKGFKFILADINPILRQMAEVKLLRLDPQKDWEPELNRCLFALESGNRRFVPNWRGIDYWYAPPVLELLMNRWGNLKEIDSPLRPIIAFALLRISRFFSWDEDKAPKLFKSKRKTEELQKILGGNWKDLMKTQLEKTAAEYLARVIEFNRFAEYLVNEPVYEIFSGIDISEPAEFPRIGYDLVVTSPPYLQAQEYLRTSKLDLYWLGYSEKEISSLAKREIPYKKPPADWWREYPTLEEVASSHAQKNLVVSYFYYLLKAFDLTLENLSPGGHICVFLGSPRAQGNEIPIWRFIADHFERRGLEIIEVLEDRIANRKLFKGRKNLNPMGMESEFLLVARKAS